ncbi:hypothetical protein NDU88_009474 [Pleurodeles waltl]|uniref:Uncharacterized protein n=1 Tax=Pleurodeles waltl TaxID=8319 RepID=A0AAV7RYI4_PLEWA|nr:hypothetical protein NDU88_009474 [Pleurodeles waltl]
MCTKVGVGAKGRLRKGERRLKPAQLLQPAVPLWRLRPEALEDPEYRIDALATLQGYVGENWSTTHTRRVEWEALKVVMREVSIRKVYGIQRKLERELT